ncbi:oligopeptide/dipeptide ABC transporter ATP-binding protein [Nonomuraea dietziae]|uniref:Oligopeptide/dipeptide ABC transporter ATP-binding protein n=1 Tax=Nonomuraea dietziae TaxID=65515 RepID=A0A7W5VKI4_9ACTN|nr:oligopeptide/dipeptide ABC transporter ATP-binding protein [Nonomuraea dietziae]
MAVIYLGRIVESGPVEQVLTTPRHPYTQALLSVLPESPERIVLTGETPDPTRIPGGYRFRRHDLTLASPRSRGRAMSAGRGSRVR